MPTNAGAEIYDEPPGWEYGGFKNQEELDRYEAWIEEEEKRGPRAFLPHTLYCYECTMDRAVLKEGAVIDQRFDATQTYELRCGHVTF